MTKIFKKPAEHSLKYIFSLQICQKSYIVITNQIYFSDILMVCVFIFLGGILLTETLSITGGWAIWPLSGQKLQNQNNKTRKNILGEGVPKFKGADYVKVHQN